MEHMTDRSLFLSNSNVFLFILLFITFSIILNNNHFLFFFLFFFNVRVLRKRLADFLES